MRFVLVCVGLALSIACSSTSTNSGSGGAGGASGAGTGGGSSSCPGVASFEFQGECATCANDGCSDTFNECDPACLERVRVMGTCAVNGAPIATCSQCGPDDAARAPAAKLLECLHGHSCCGL